jgi:hypothetical protein
MAGSDFVRWRTLGRPLPAVFALVLMVSCRGPKDALIPVAGTITVKKQPLASGIVIFHPDRDKGNKDKREPRATIAGDLPGGYRLTTDDQDGAPGGWYKVTVHAHQTATSSMRPPEWLVHSKYADEKTSGLSVSVVRDAPARTYDFELDPPN